MASDNWAGVHPTVTAAIADANDGPAVAYGDDPWTGRVETWLRDLLGSDAGVALVWGGTGANVIAMQLLAPGPRTGVICAPEAHIGNHEGGAPEHIAGVALIRIPSHHARIAAGDIVAAIPPAEAHLAQAAAVSISQPTELGTLYRPDEVRAICDAAHAAGLRVHMDGARLANAAAALDVPVRAFTADAGVDVLCFGGTKNAMLGAEAVVAFDPALARDLPFVRMRSLHLASKGRFVAAQFLAMAEDDLWLRTAAHANAMAARLAAAVDSAVEISRPVETNAVFARLDPEAIERLRADVDFHVWDPATGEVRLMTSWQTTEAEVDAVADAVRRASAR